MIRYYKYNNIIFRIEDNYDFHDWEDDWAAFPINQLAVHCQTKKLNDIIKCISHKPFCDPCNFILQYKEGLGMLDRYKI